MLLGFHGWDKSWPNSHEWARYFGPVHMEEPKI